MITEMAFAVFSFAALSYLFFNKHTLDYFKRRMRLA